MKYNKLIRDNIPAIIVNKGGNPITHVATDQEYEQKLLEKLAEEVAEFTEVRSLEEMADIKEVLLAIYELYGFKKEAVEKIRQQKKEERGGFSEHIILEES